MKFIRNKKELEVKDGSKILLIDEVLPILFRYPHKIQVAVLNQLEPFEVTVEKEEENEG